MKKKLALLLAFMLVLPLALTAQAQTVVKPQDMAYAYIVADRPYMTVGEPITFTLTLSEPHENYTYEYSFCEVIMKASADKNELHTLDFVKKSKSITYTATPDEPGFYMLIVTVLDNEFKAVELRTETFVAEPAEAHDDPETVTGKVRALVAEVNALELETDYEKALWLHDWLIFNADYDESLTVHAARGVLLDGTGVCESYALAYQMLLGEIGIPSIYVTGYARGELHAWNLVSLEDEWYHIDTTWDDPVGGGNEGYGYFGLSDQLMGRDHDWSRQNFVFPAAQGEQFNYLKRNGALQFANEAEMDAVLSEAMAAKLTPVQYLYTGDDLYFGAMDQVGIWLKNNRSKYGIDTWAQSGSRFSGKTEIVYGDYDDFRFFEDDAGLAAALDEAMAAQQNPIKVKYSGTDRFYYLSTPLRNWLESNSRKHFVKEYSYQYTDTDAEIQVTYGDYSEYLTFEDDAGLQAILADAIANRTTALKLYYTGTEAWYSLNSKLLNWQMDNKDTVRQYYGTWGPSEADITVEYK